MTIEVEDEAEPGRKIITMALGGRVLLMKAGNVDIVEIIPVGHQSGLAHLDLYIDSGVTLKGLGPVTFEQAKGLARFFLVDEVTEWDGDDDQLPAGDHIEMDQS